MQLKATRQQAWFTARGVTLDHFDLKVHVVLTIARGEAPRFQVPQRCCARLFWLRRYSVYIFCLSAMSTNGRRQAMRIGPWSKVRQCSVSALGQMRRFCPLRRCPLYPQILIHRALKLPLTFWPCIRSPTGQVVSPAAEALYAELDAGLTA